MSLKILRIAGCGTCVLLAAATCKPPPDPCEGPDQHTIMFIDQSASSVANPATTAMFRDTLADVLATRLQCQGDAVHGFLVHQNTRGKSDRVQVVNTVPPADTLDKPQIDATRERTRFNKEMQAFRAEGETRLGALLSAEVDPRFKRHTDLIGALEVVSDQLAQADSGSRARVYFLGDMHESMPSSRRDFDRRPPASRAEAEAWADADTAVLKGMNVVRERLANVEVRVLLGDLANKPGAPEVRSYWERLFANAGIPPTRILWN